MVWVIIMILGSSYLFSSRNKASSVLIKAISPVFSISAFLPFFTFLYFILFMGFCLWGGVLEDRIVNGSDKTV